MSLKESIDGLKYDARMTDINLKSSALTPAELQKHLEKLPDLEANCETVAFGDSSDWDDEEEVEETN
jgi:hypothetical protein